MSIDFQKLRLFGVYQQDKEGNLMLRVKIPAGLLTNDQARMICRLSERFSNGVLHLTTRGSIEFHWLRHESLEEMFTFLAEVGLTTRGACGGAVRGISCSTTFAPGYAVVQRIAENIHRHFAGNPDFEGLPKKFKVAVDADYRNSRHLIQDIGLVMTQASGEECRFDVWCAGGLGREPRPGFLLEKNVAQQQLIPMIASVVRIYRDNTPPPKRLKYLLAQIGEDAFRQLLQADMAQYRKSDYPSPEPQHRTLDRDSSFVEIPVFAGEITSERLRQLSNLAAEHSSGELAVTADQNIALLVHSKEQRDALHKALELFNEALEGQLVLPHFRICPGNHECRMGLAATREVALQINALVGAAGVHLNWAIAGCCNSCSQPQLADIGIVTKKLVTAAEGSKQPLFDLLRRDDQAAFGSCIGENLQLEDLYSMIRSLV